MRQPNAGTSGPAKKVVRKAAKPYTPPQTPDSRDNNQAARHPAVSHVSPDAQDVAGRSTQQKARDRTAVAKTVSTQRRVVLRKREAASPSLTGKATSFVARHFVPHTDAATQKYLDAHPDAKPGNLPGEKAQAAYPAPVLKVLAATTRPLHAIAGAANEDVKTIKSKGLAHYLEHGSGSRSIKAAQSGIEGKGQTTFSDVLKTAGVKSKAARTVAGFALDVGLDPTTYATFGAGGVADHAAASAAAGAEKKALAQGLTKDQAAAFGERAAKGAVKKAPQDSGVTVKLAGHEVPGVRRATAAAARPVRRVVKIPQGLRTHARAIAGDVNPDVAPVGVSKAESRAAVQATRTARAKTSHGIHIAQQQATGIAKTLSKDQYSQVIDAIEAGTLGTLPDDLRAVAIKVRSQFRHANRLRKQAGIRGGEIKARRVHVPDVTADVPGAQEKLAEAVKHRGAIQRKPARLTRVPSREEFIANAPKAHRDSEAPTIERLTRNVKDSKQAGYSIEPEHVAQVDRVTRERVGWGREIPRSKVVVRRDLHGRVIGALHMTLDSQGKPDVLEIAVAPAFQGKGVASRLYSYAQRHGLDVESASGRGGYTTAGAALAHKRLVARAVTQDKVSAKVLRAARGDVGRAQQELDRTLAQKRTQQLARRKAVKRQGLQRQGKLPQGYIPHQLTEETVQAEGKATSGVGRKVIRPASSKVRKEQRSLAELRAAEPGRYSEDLPTLFANRMASGHESVARAELNRHIADMGTTIRKGQDVHLAANENVYHILGSDIRKVDPKEVGQVLDQGGKNGRYVALNDDVVKRALEGVAPKMEGPGVVHALDKTTAGFKRVAIATPGFHVRNIIGDLNNAYLGQAAHRLPGNMTRAGRVLKAYGRSERALRDLTPAQVGEATLKTKLYGDVTYDEAAKQLRDHGAFRSGYIAREMPELSRSGGRTPTESLGRVRRVLRKVHEVPGQSRAGQTAKRAILGREDLPRLTTAMQALREGATWEQAAQKVADLHFDYQHLTNFERQIARRVAPFYTWSSRNIPLQAKSLVTKPGKFATYEKVREEAAKASSPGQVDPQTKGLYQQLAKAGVDLPGGWEKYLSTYEARNAGIPISWKGHKFTLSAGQPLGDLSEFPGAAGAAQAGEYMDRAAQVVNPLIKDPVELAFNYSFFFRDKIERDTSPLVAAPSYVGALPAAAKKKLGVAKIVDKRSGKKVWAWPGRVDYVAHVVPGVPNYAQQFATPGGDRQGKGFAGKALQFSGIRSVPIDPVRNAVNLAYARQAEIQKQLSGLRQQGIGKNNPTAEWRRLNDQLRIVVGIAFQGKAAQGYKVLPTQGGPPKVRSAGKVTLGGSVGATKVTLGGGSSAGSKVTLTGG